MDGDAVTSVAEAEHAATLTRDTITPAVHYLRFGFTEAQVGAFRDADDVALVATHPAYEAQTVLPPPCGPSCSGTCSGQQSLYLSPDQGQLCAQVFTELTCKPYSSFA